MNDIFISYKVYDRPTAIEYYKQLKGEGYSVWFDQLIPKENDWDKEIKNQILNSRVIVCLLSENVLKDKWVLQQIKFARNYDKEIIFINIDGANIKEYHKFSSYGEIFSNIRCVDFKGYLDKSTLFSRYEKNDKQKNKYLRHFFFSFSLILLFSIYVLFNGVIFLNISLKPSFGWVLIGINVLLFLSLIPRRRAYQINGLLALVGLLVCMFYVEPYYISDVSIIPILAVAFYFLAHYIRYSHRNLFLAVIIGSIYTVLLILVSHTILMFFIYMLDINLIILIAGILIGYLFYQYFNLHNFFRIHKQCKDIAYEIKWYSRKKIKGEN